MGIFQYLLIMQALFVSIAKLKILVDLSSADVAFLVGATFFVFLLVGAAIYMFKRFGLI